MIRRHWKAIAWLGFWGTGLHNAFAYVGLHYTTATNGVILNSSIPVLIILTGWILYRDTITRVQALGVAISHDGRAGRAHGRRPRRCSRPSPSTAATSSCSPAWSSGRCTRCCCA